MRREMRLTASVADISVSNIHGLQHSVPCMVTMKDTRQHISSHSLAITLPVMAVAGTKMSITGRVDDIINVSGHRIGTAEVESALVSHPRCAEAAVVGVEHDVKGQGIYAFVTLVDGVPNSEELRKSLIMCVRKQIGAFAAPDKIRWAPGLPKISNGKIMRRILRKIASRQLDELGDISTLTEPSVVDQLISLADV